MNCERRVKLNNHNKNQHTDYFCCFKTLFFFVHVCQVPSSITSSQQLLISCSLSLQFCFQLEHPKNISVSCIAFLTLVVFTQHNAFVIDPCDCLFQQVFLFIAEQYSFLQTYHTLLSQLPVNAQLGYFCFGFYVCVCVIMN